MKFTDDEVGMLKRMIELGSFPVSAPALRGLLERLQAAERWNFTRQLRGDYQPDEAELEAEKVWREAAGK